MRFAHVRVAAVTLLSGSFLTLGVLGTAQAAPTATTANTDKVCQALPLSSGTPTPSPSPSPSPPHSPSPSPSPSPSTSAPSTSPPASTSAAATTPPPTVLPPTSASSVPRQTTSPPPSQDTSPSPSQSGTSGTSAPAAALDAYVATSPSSSPSPQNSGSTSTGTTAPPELCVSVQRSQSSIKRGQTATYIVQVSTQNATASNVSVALTTQPSSQKPTFTSGCAKGDGTASCAISSVTAKQPASLNAQIAVGAKATSVSSVKLTATASVATTQKWTPPAAAETTAVTATAPAKSAKASPTATHTAVLPLGPIPALNGQASMLIGAGNAAALFPTIGPSHGASPEPTAAAAQPSTKKTAPAADASPVSLGTPVATAQVAGLIALGLAIMLTVTRLSVRKRRPGKPRS
jgi:hypothetical protein